MSARVIKDVPYSQAKLQNRPFPQQGWSLGFFNLPSVAPVSSLHSLGIQFPKVTLLWEAVGSRKA